MLNYNCKGNTLQYKLILNNFYKNNYAKNLTTFSLITISHLILNLIPHLIFENFENISHNIFTSKR